MVIIPLKNFKEGQLKFLNSKLKGIAETILLSSAEDDGLNEKFWESNKCGH